MKYEPLFHNRPPIPLYTTVTGRCSSTEPNTAARLQWQLPREDNRPIKDDKGPIVCILDYSQIEMRIMAQYQNIFDERADICRKRLIAATEKVKKSNYA